IVVSGAKHYPGEWRLLQRIVVREKFVNYSSRRWPYEIVGDPEKGQKFNLETQGDLTGLLHNLEFVSGKRITASGREIGITLQAIRPLSKNDTVLLRQYAQNIERHWADIGLNNLLEAKFKVGAGFGDAETNRKVERAAILFTTNWYKASGWYVKSVETEKLGYDLRCMKGSAEENVEVKGVQGEIPTFIITAREAKQADTNSKFIICVITSAL